MVSLGCREKQGKEVRMGWSVGFTGEVGREEERLQLICFGAREEAEGLRLWEQRE